MGIIRYVYSLYRYFLFPISLIVTIYLGGIYLFYFYYFIPATFFLLIDLLDPSSWGKYSLEMYDFMLFWNILILLSNISFFKFVKNVYPDMVGHMLLALYVIHGVMQAFMYVYEVVRYSWYYIFSFPLVCNICEYYSDIFYYSTWISSLLFIMLFKIVFPLLDRRKEGAGWRR